MNEINEVILNPWFFISFLGTAILLPICAYLFRGTDVFMFILIASMVYLLGTIGVTMIGNVPLNLTMAEINTEVASADAMKATREAVETKWNNWHTARTIAACVSLALLLWSLFKAK